MIWPALLVVVLAPQKTLSLVTLEAILVGVRIFNYDFNSLSYFKPQCYQLNQQFTLSQFSVVPFNKCHLIQWNISYFSVWHYRRQSDKFHYNIFRKLVKPLNGGKNMKFKRMYSPASQSWYPWLKKDILPKLLLICEIDAPMN